MGNKLIILGSSAEFPFPRTASNKFEDYLNIGSYRKKFELHDDKLCQSAKKGGKDRRIRSAMALVINKRVVLFDAGPDIKFQLKRYRLKPNIVFISHNHPDADYGLKYLPKTVEVFSEKNGNVAPGKEINIFGLRIFPFRVIHSEIAPYLGYRITVGSKKVVYITDLASLKSVGEYAKGCDILFADGSILKRNLGGHLSIVNQLRVYKKWGLKKVIFTHIGHATLKHEDLVKFIKGWYKNADVAYDGMIIRP